MAELLNLTPSQREDLLIFSKIDWSGADLEGIRAGWASAMIPEDLVAVFKSRGINAGGDPEAAARVLVTLRLLGVQSELPATEIISALSDNLADSDWPEDFLKNWPAAEKALGLLLPDPSVRRVAMVVNLSYEYSHLFQSARIITDVRPIFAENLEAIEAAVVSHTLRLRYDSAEGDHTISLALDDIDVRRLHRQCERALQKADIAAKTISSAAGLPIFVSGRSSATRTPND